MQYHDHGTIRCLERFWCCFSSVTFNSSSHRVKDQYSDTRYIIGGIFYIFRRSYPLYCNILQHQCYQTSIGSAVPFVFQRPEMLPSEGIKGQSNVWTSSFLSWQMSTSVTVYANLHTYGCFGELQCLM